MKRIIVTGGLGFIGSNLINVLIRKNFNVINVDKVIRVDQIRSQPRGILPRGRSDPCRRIGNHFANHFGYHVFFQPILTGRSID